MENLFDNPTTLRDPEYFVGRREQLGRIFGLIKGRQSLSLVGPRRIGKTSLLSCLKNPNIQQKFGFDGSGYFFLYLDLQTRALKAQVDFFTDVHRTLKEYAQAQGYSFTEELDQVEEFDALIKDFQQSGLHPVLIMDTFDEILQYQSVQESVFSFFRSFGTSREISYIIASVETLGNISYKLFPQSAGASPLYNILGVVKLTTFTLEEAEMLLVDTSAQSGLPFSEEEVNWVLDLAGTHPFLLQQVATLLFEEKRMQGAEKVDYEYIQREAQQHLVNHFRDCWEMLEHTDRQKVLESMRSSEVNAQQRRSASRIYPELCGSQLFRNYLREIGVLATTPPIDLPPPVETSEINTETLKKTLELLKNPAKLGSSEIIGIPFIRRRIEEQQAASPFARGKIVQSVLQELLNSIKGQGEYLDQSNDLTDYNILYYRYFIATRLSGKTIAKRLSISERQFYRLLILALDKLRNALLEKDVLPALDENGIKLKGGLGV